MHELLTKGAMIIDVRSPAEFASGHPLCAVNIPLDQLARRLDELKRELPIVLCCASGGRSGRATTMLCSLGYDAHNAGPWTNLPH